MDDLRFDALARSLTAGQSRRGVLRVVAAAALGTLFSARTVREAAAACREAGQRCSEANGCCPGSRCRSGFCKCKLTQGFKACNGPGTRCVNTTTSDEHCGNCNEPCPENHVCIDRGCIDHCEDGERDGDETDRDCGGDRCPKCGLGKACVDDDDCRIGPCAGGTCVQCTTNAHCAPLAPLAGFCVNNVCRQCSNDSHCPSDVCIANTCEECRNDADCPAAKPTCNQFHVCRGTCTNSRLDSGESDIDCGGSTCPKCADDKKCVANADCQSGFCVTGRCSPARCGPGGRCCNEVRDGDESDINCGGEFCPKCKVGQTCKKGSDCETFRCGIVDDRQVCFPPE